MGYVYVMQSLSSNFNSNVTLKSKERCRVVVAAPSSMKHDVSGASKYRSICKATVDDYYIRQETSSVPVSGRLSDQRPSLRAIYPRGSVCAVVLGVRENTDLARLPFVAGTCSRSGWVSSLAGTRSHDSEPKIWSLHVSMSAYMLPN